MRHRKIELRWRLTCERNELRELFGRELRRPSALGIVTYDLEDQLFKIVVADILFLCACKQAHLRRETAAPPPHALGVDAEVLDVLPSESYDVALGWALTPVRGLQRLGG